MEKINIAELLKDCPSGMELDCTMFEGVFLERIDKYVEYPIVIRVGKTDVKYLTKEGCWNKYSNAKCVIFPKGRTTWEGFHRPFKDGDVVCYSDCIAIFKEWGDETLFRTYVTAYLHGDSTIDIAIPLFGKSIRRETRLATEEEKQKLFQAIKDNGYKWNAETKTLEKLRQFKVGDIVRLKSKPNCVYTIHSLTWDDNKQLAYRLLPNNDKHLILVSLNAQDDYELVPNKFDITTLVPFESRVLVRSDINRYWIPAFWGFKHNGVYNTTRGWDSQCIPYEGNEHLLGTTDDCDEYFKTWKQ